ncbi:MAG: hypothetical protein WC758_08660 [Candidatus Woesearchaeota archaeon]|jgi:hypothetical protein
MKSHKQLLPLLQRVKDKIKKSDTVKDMCKEYGQDVDIVDLVPMAFADLDVSARTDKGVIYFNYSLLDTPEEIDSYAAHELTHFFQQAFGDGPTSGSNDSEDYLDNEFEQEGFQAQTEYLSETRDDQAAIDYVEKVLDHHNVEPKDRKKRKDELLSIAQQFFFKQSGTFKVPEDVLSIISNWVNQIVASWVKSFMPNMNFSEDKLKKYLESDFSDDMKNRLALNFEANKYSDKTLSRETRRTLKIPLKIFTHPDFNISQEDIINTIKKNKWGDDIYINLYPNKTAGPFAQNPNLEGQWSDRTQSVFLYVDVINIDTVQEFYEQLDEVKETLHHELQHIMQNLLSKIIGNSVGAPTRKIMTQDMAKQHPNKYKDQIVQDDLDPAEFQPKLTDEIMAFNRMYNGLDKKLYFKDYISNSRFFNNLKKHDHLRWQKAIKEFVKATETVT